MGPFWAFSGDFAGFQSSNKRILVGFLQFLGSQYEPDFLVWGSRPVEDFLLRDFPIADFLRPVAVDEFWRDSAAPGFWLTGRPSKPKLTRLPVTEFRLPPYDESAV